MYETKLLGFERVYEIWNWENRMAKQAREDYRLEKDYVHIGMNPG